MRPPTYDRIDFKTWKKYLGLVKKIKLKSILGICLTKLQKLLIDGHRDRINTYQYFQYTNRSLRKDLILCFLLSQHLKTIKVSLPKASSTFSISFSRHSTKISPTLSHSSSVTSTTIDWLLGSVVNLCWVAIVIDSTLLFLITWLLTRKLLIEYLPWCLNYAYQLMMRH